MIDDALVRSLEERFQCVRFVFLTGRQMKVQGMAMRIAEQMDFRGKSAARTP